MSELVLAAACCVGFLGLLGLLEWTVRTKRLKSFITRRIAHIAAGLFALFMWTWVSPPVYIGLLVTLIACMTISQLRGILLSVHGVDRKTIGEVLLPLGILITYVMSHDKPTVFVPALLIVTLADSFAGIVSDMRRKKRSSKIGSIVFFVTCCIVLATTTHMAVLQLLVLSSIVTVTERISPFGSDNLTIPLVATLLLL